MHTGPMASFVSARISQLERAEMIFNTLKYQTISNIQVVWPQLRK